MVNCAQLGSVEKKRRDLFCGVNCPVQRQFSWLWSVVGLPRWFVVLMAQLLQQVFFLV